MLGTYCGAYLGARMQGIILVPLLFIYFLIIFFKKESKYYKIIILPIVITILLGIGKYLLNFVEYGTPIPLNINDSTSLSLTKLFKNYKILVNQILDRSWNFYGLLSFQANSAIVGFLISFFIIPYAFFGILIKNYIRSHKSSFAIFIIGIIFLLISMLTLEQPSQNYVFRLWLPFIFTTIIYGTDIINTLIKENKIIPLLFIFAFTMLCSVVIYGGLYRKSFMILLIIILFYLTKKKTLKREYLLFTFSFIVTTSSIWYVIMNISYDKYSPVLNYVELNQQFNQQPLVKLSKYLSPEDRVGFLNLKKGERIPIYDLFGNKHNIHARLVFDWVDKKNLRIHNTKDLKSNFDYLLLHKSDNTPFLKIDEFLFVENFDDYLVYRNKKKYFTK